METIAEKMKKSLTEQEYLKWRMDSAANEMDSLVENLRSLRDNKAAVDTTVVVRALTVLARIEQMQKQLA